MRWGGGVQSEKARKEPKSYTQLVHRLGLLSNHPLPAPPPLAPEGKAASLATRLWGFHQLSKLGAGLNKYLQNSFGPADGSLGIKNTRGDPLWASIGMTDPRLGPHPGLAPSPVQASEWLQPQRTTLLQCAWPCFLLS